MKKYSPIPINEFIGRNCGFEFEQYRNAFCLDLKTVFDAHSYLKTKDFKNYVFGFYGNIKLEYLHELQNFYRELTKTNLTINL